jgi:hypothetical protein
MPVLRKCPPSNDIKALERAFLGAFFGAPPSKKPSRLSTHLIRQPRAPAWQAMPRPGPDIGISDGLRFFLAYGLHYTAGLVN